jgi:hypothetical protein
VERKHSKAGRHSAHRSRFLSDEHKIRSIQIPNVCSSSSEEICKSPATSVDLLGRSDGDRLSEVAIRAITRGAISTA